MMLQLHHSQSPRVANQARMRYAPLAVLFALAFALAEQFGWTPWHSPNRLTLVAVWSGSDYQPYFRNLISSTRLNADSADLIIINRIDQDGDRCLDLSQHGIDLSQDSNVRLYCLSNVEWKSRHVDFLCSARYGWNCNDDERDGVARVMMDSKDRLNCEWKPFRGHIFHDLFIHPRNPLWAWVDLDMHFGSLAAYPFEALRRSTLVTGFYAAPSRVFMAGQFTAFNMKDATLPSAWKAIPSLQSPQRFMQGAWHKGASDETFWSRAIMGAQGDSFSDALSWAVIGNMHGQDWFDNPEKSYLVSGREVFQLEEKFSREEMETLLNATRADQEQFTFGSHFLPAASRGSASWAKAQVTKLIGTHESQGQTVPLLHGSECAASWIPFRYA